MGALHLHRHEGNETPRNAAPLVLAPQPLREFERCSIRKSKDKHPPLETQPQSDLGRAAGTGTGHNAKVGSSERKPWDVEICVVEQIVEFTAYIKFQALSDLESLFQRRVRGYELCSA